MSMKSKNVKEMNWDNIFSVENEEEQIELDAQMLMFRFLSEVEKYQELKGITKKALAEKINTSASYITQLFRGDKPLNFYTIAKIQKALAIKFAINSYSEEQEYTIDNEEYFVNKGCKHHTDKGYWTFTNVKLMNKAMAGDKYNIGKVIDKVKEQSTQDESEALLACA